MSHQKLYTFDKDLQLKDAGLVAASAAAQVGGAAKILDLGAGRFDGVVVVDLAAVEVATGDESYHIECQFSNDSAFGSTNIVGASVKLGDSTVNFGSADTPATGRVEIPFTNEILGTIYRYMRLFTRIAGTIATGINYTAWVAQQE
jgi:hypothetical protein